MKKRFAESGFGVVEIIAVVVAVLIVGGVGYYAYQKNQTNSNTSPAAQQENSSEQNDANNTQPDPNAGYLVIEEWGVKLKMEEAAKVTYTYSSESVDPRNGEQADSSITLQVKPEYLQDKSCKVSVGWTRYKTIEDSATLQYTKKIGDYYFMSGGSPYACDNAADDALNKRVRADFGSIEAL